MKIEADNIVIHRVPKFSYESTLEECWDDLKQCINHSSIDFYKLIQPLQFKDLVTLEDSFRFTIWKYFNRGKFRATPFASFAAVGICNACYNPETKLVFDDKQILQRYPDWREAEKLQVDLEYLSKRNVLLIANNSYYIIDENVRYLDRIEGKFELAEQSKNDLLVSILEKCQYPISAKDLPLHFRDIEQEALYNVVVQMIDDQLLLTSLHPNLIGYDYFERSGIKQPFSGNDYIIAKRQAASGKLDMKAFRHLTSLVEKLHSLVPNSKATHLEQFISHFSKKFGERYIPLMEALDPELGIGYGNMETAAAVNPLIENLLNAKKTSNHPTSPAETVSLLFSTIIQEGCTSIDLETVTQSQESNKEPLPNSLPVLCSLSSGYVYIEHLGGSTSNMLLGRFSLGDDEIAGYCRSIAEKEAQANPEVLFFDIAYPAGGKIDNVNRRQNIYDLQLSILNYDTSSLPLAINDLYLSVQNDRLILHSKRLKKVLIPRIASAYNYQLSDLPLFRMLCDLQYQGIHRNLFLRLRDSLPGLDYYPEIYYRNIIVSPRTWRIEQSNAIGSTNQIREILTSKKISRFVKTGTSDQTLVFDLHKDEDLGFLLLYLKQQKTIYLEETKMPDVSAFADQTGKPYLPQFIFNLNHDSELYKPLSFNPYNYSKPEPILPNKPWLYFELYCHPQRTDQILTEIIYPFTFEYKGKIKQWFFIRYNENGHHLRLRLHLRNPEDGHIITHELSNALFELIKNGIIKDLQIRLYTRETERYGIRNMPAIEDLFCLDSIYIMKLLNKAISQNDAYKDCISLLTAIRKSEIIKNGVFDLFIARQNTAYNKEHSLLPSQFKILNDAYKLLFKDKSVNYSYEQDPILSKLQNSWIEVLGMYKPEERPHIMGALFHMHVNRFFATDQRLHETIIYYFMEKSLKRMNNLVR